ncbi:hypothetical protein ISCGN_010184 [Ixodes scapularis]
MQTRQRAAADQGETGEGPDPTSQDLMARVANLCDTVAQRLVLADHGPQGQGPRPQVPVPLYTGYDDRKSVADFLAELAAYKLATGASDEYVLARVLPVAFQASAARCWPGFRELVEAGVGKALPRPEVRADDEGVRSSSLEEVVCDGPSLGTEGGARGTTPDAFGGDTSFGAMVSIASFKRGAAAPFRHCEPFGSNDKRGRGADLGGAGGVGGAARSLGQTWVPTEVFGDTPPDTRLQEAGAKVVCCLARGAPKGPNLPRAQLNHQDALFPGHGLATHSQTWVGLSHFYSGSVVSPKWLGSVVTLLTKHLAPKVQAPPAELGVRGDATLQTPAFTERLPRSASKALCSKAAFHPPPHALDGVQVRPDRWPLQRADCTVLQ